MELIKTRCTQGKLIVTETHIIVELLNLRSQSLARESYTGLDVAMGWPSFFGLGGGKNLVFHGKGGERLHANLVQPKQVKRIQEILTSGH